MGLLRFVLDSSYTGMLEKLEIDVDSVLSNIAFNGRANDLKYIRNARYRLKKKYDGFVNSLRSLPYNESPLLLAISCIGDAYDDLMSPFYKPWGRMSLGEREEEASSILAEHNFLGNGVAIPVSFELNRIGKTEAGFTLYEDGSFEIDRV